MGVLRFVVAFVCVICVVAYIAPTWFKNNSTCGYCFCRCSSPNDLMGKELLDSSHTDCENNPELKKELKKDIIALLHEEISLQKLVTYDTLKHTKDRTDLVKRASSHYKKKVEKCIAGVETCEEARVRAEAELREELKLTALWEKRARDLGWKRNYLAGGE